METLYTNTAAVCSSIIIAVALVSTWKFLNWAWFGPKKIETSLRHQGFRGNPYTFPFGDYKELRRMQVDAHSKPMELHHHILPRIMPFFDKLFRNFGGNCFLWLGPLPILFVSDPEIIREILAKSYIFQKPYHAIGKMLARGLASYETDKWAKHRRLIHPAFHPDKIKNMLPSFYICCREMLRKWEDIVPKEGSCEVDVLPYLQALTSDAISRNAFGSNYEEGRKIFELQKQQIGLVMKAILPSLIPGWRFLPTKTNRKMKRNLKEIESLIHGIIDKRMKTIETRGANSQENLLDILLESNLVEARQHGHKFGMSLEDVVEECKLFYIAGHETTSSLLVWTMILLSKHVDWQVRAREEVFQVFGNRKPDFEGLPHLKIMNMILHEVLRLYPPAPILSRKTHKKISVGNIVLPPGVQLMLSTIVLQHDHHIWGDNATMFDPERFSEGVSNMRKGKLAYFPFGWGPRICIGQNFVMVEAKVALVSILQNYCFELSPSYMHAPSSPVTLQPQHGAPLLLRRFIN